MMQNKFFTILFLFPVILSGCGVDWFPGYVRTPTTPDAFSFTPSVTPNVAPGSTVTSNAITVTGILSGSAPISVTGDPSSQYSINGSVYSKSAGTVNNSDKVTVQHTATSGVGQTTTTTLTIGDQSSTFFSVTANVASFNVTKSAPAGTSAFSGPISLSVAPGSYVISVTNGLYSFDAVSFVNTTQTIFFNINQIIYLENVAPINLGETVTTTITIDGVVSTFKTTAI